MTIAANIADRERDKFVDTGSVPAVRTTAVDAAGVSGNTEGTLLASAARTTTISSADQTNHSARGVHVTLTTTVIGTGSITLTIQEKDPVSGTYSTILAGAAVVTDTTNVYKVYPGLPATANVSANDVLPLTWRATVSANNANAATYSVSYALIG